MTEKQSSLPARLSPEAWEPHEFRVRQLYLEEKRSVADIAGIIKDETGFTATLAQWNNQINQGWKLRKNFTKRDFEYIDKKKRQREAEGKESEILLCDVPVSEEDLRQKRQRMYVSTIELYQNLAKRGRNNVEECPSTPPGLQVRTPRARSPSPFAWMVEQFGAILDSNPFSFMADPLHLKTPSYTFSGILEKARFSFVYDLSYAHAEKQQEFVQRNILAPSHVNRYQSRRSKSMIPFKIPSSSLSLEDLMEFLKVHIVRLGNNVDDPKVHTSFLDKLLLSGVLSGHMPVLRKLLQADNSILHNFAIELFYSASRTGTLDLQRLIFQLHDGGTKPPNFWKSNRHRIIATAAQFALERQQGAAYAFLMKVDFDVNVSPCSEFSKSLLHTAILIGNKDIVEELICRGARDVYDERLGKIQYSEYLHGLGMIGYAWAKIATEMKFNLQVPATNGVHLAILLRKKDITKFLVSHIEGELQDFTYSEVDHSKLHFYAVMSHDDELLQNMLQSTELYIDIEAKSSGTTALYWATINGGLQGELRCFRVLLENGADPTVLLGSVHILEYYWPTLRSVLDELGLEDFVSELDLRIKTAAEERAKGGYYYRGPTNPLNVHGRFPNITKNKQEAFDYIDVIFGTYAEKGPQFKFSLDIIEHLVKEVLVEAVEDEDIFTSLKGVLWDPKDFPRVEAIVSLINRLGAINLESDFDWQGPWVGAGTSISWQKKSVLHTKGIEKYNFPKQGKREEVIHEWEKACMNKANFDTEMIYPDEEDYEPDFLEKVCYLTDFSRCLSQFQKLGVQLRCGDFENLRHILEWALSISDHRILRNLVSICLPYIECLTFQQVQAFLRLAVRRSLHSIVRKILSLSSASYINDTILREAIWNEDTTIFDTIIDAYAPQLPLPKSIEHMLVIPICDGNLHKVIKIVENQGFNVNAVFAGKFTFIELAAKLGRIDITQVLLDRGASKNLDHAVELALDSGYFALAEMIKVASRNRSKSRPRGTRREVIEEESDYTGTGLPTELIDPSDEMPSSASQLDNCTLAVPEEVTNGASDTFDEFLDWST
ncbi:hypothetical protein ABW19_dt0200666 [Dactylella cylindrospora]|nr:hypothetical protein ABW19_dt0200666 [Dactylella cylindrospora]